MNAAGLHIEKRMRRYGEKIGTRSGLAWLSAFEAVKVWYGGDIKQATVLLREAAENLEAVPMIYDAARLRRQLAGRLGGPRGSGRCASRTPARPRRLCENRRATGVEKDTRDVR